MVKIVKSICNISLLIDYLVENAIELGHRIVAFLKKISSSFSDQELVERYRETHGLDLLGELYQRYMELVYGVCLKYLKDRDQAQDSVMAIFEELVTKLKKHEVDNFKAWLYTLAKNHCLMRLRSEKRG